MHIIVVADGDIKEEFKNKKTNAGIKITYAAELSEISDCNDADCFFILKEGIHTVDNRLKNKPVIINATLHTLKELEMPQNVSRINGWQTFLKREVLEIATTNENIIKNIFEGLGWRYLFVADEPGLVSARIIAMIINEAYYAFGDGVSSKKEIDEAMKLGTNYPYGPFEWSSIIGLQKINALLEILSKTDMRYAIAPALKKELDK